MAQFRTCPNCGANLDPEERCDCLKREQKLRKQKREASRMAEQEGMWEQQKLAM